MKQLIRRRAAVMTFFALLAGSAFSQTERGSGALPDVATQAPASRVAAPYPIIREPAATAADLQTLREEVGRLQSTLQADIASVRPAWWEKLIPALIGLAGVLVGGLITWRLQRRQLDLNEKLHAQQLKETERIGQAKAGYDSLSKLIEYQTRQVNEFYSPLRLMLRRSRGVRDQLCDQLQAANSQRFVFVPEADGRKHLFVVEPNGEQTRFRLIEHMHEVATQYAEFFPLVKEIINIGKTMTGLIDSKGGLAIDDNDRLTMLLGGYLAHYSILRDVAKKAEQSPAVLASVKYNVSYPNELDDALKNDMATLTAKIEEWKRLSETMWQGRIHTID